MVLEHRVYNEKRNFIRMKINTPIQIMVGEETFVARCKDLSGSGVLIQSDRSRALGSTVQRLIEADSDKHLPFNATGEVVRVDPVNPSGYILGLALTAIHE